MPFPPTDLLKHILDEAEFIEEQTKGLSFDDLESNILLQKALLRCIEVIGEATKTINIPFREKYPEIDWRNMARMRDRLIHHYFDVDLEIVYNTCITDIPDLVFNVKAILSLEEKKNNNPN